MSSIASVPAPDGKRNHKQARSSMISLLRGTFACPTIAALAELGLVERMLSGPFALADFPNVIDQRVLSAVFCYLHSLNLLEPTKAYQYDLTLEGRTAIKRNGAFLLLFSYRGYFENLAGILSGKAEATVDRRCNVLGSGALHSKKFFPAVWQMFKTAQPRAVIDVGCGDGQFLADACAEWPGIVCAAVDLSPIAVETTLKRLETVGRSDVVGIVQNGADINGWIETLPIEVTATAPLVLTMWFVVHEFSGADLQTVIRFFRTLRSLLPSAQIVLGEIASLPPELLAMNRDVSIMPEFLLFHELSQQGVLKWEDWQYILSNIPYNLEAENRFDVLDAPGWQTLPSSFVWHLRPS